MKLSTPAAVLLGSIVLSVSLLIAVAFMPGRYQIAHQSSGLWVRLNTASGKTAVCRLNSRADDAGIAYRLPCNSYRAFKTASRGPAVPSAAYTAPMPPVVTDTMPYPAASEDTSAIGRYRAELERTGGLYSTRTDPQDDTPSRR